MSVKHFLIPAGTLVYQARLDVQEHPTEDFTFHQQLHPVYTVREWHFTNGDCFVGPWGGKYVTDYTHGIEAPFVVRLHGQDDTPVNAFVVAYKDVTEI